MAVKLKVLVMITVVLACGTAHATMPISVQPTPSYFVTPSSQETMIHREVVSEEMAGLGSAMEAGKSSAKLVESLLREYKIQRALCISS